MNNTENRSVLDCAIVGDLLPLYHDDVVSDTTKTAVESHLEGCENCRKEYTSLCDELRVESDSGTIRQKFAGMMRRQKTKRIITTIAAAVTACALLVCGYLAQLTLPVVKVSADQVLPVRVYQYSVDGQDKIFVMIACPVFDGTTFLGHEEVRTESGTTLKLTLRKPLVCRGFDICDLVGPMIFDGDFTEIRIGDEVIWSEESNDGEPIPEYVYAFDDFSRDTGGVVGWSTSFDLEDPDFCYFSAEYVDNTQVTWDFHGNVMTTAPSDDYVQ